MIRSQNNGWTHRVICLPCLLQGRADDYDIDDRLTYSCNYYCLISRHDAGAGFRILPSKHDVQSVQQLARCITAMRMACIPGKEVHLLLQGFACHCFHEHAVQGLILVRLLKRPPKARAPGHTPEAGHKDVPATQEGSSCAGPDDSQRTRVSKSSCGPCLDKRLEYGASTCVPAHHPKKGHAGSDCARVVNDTGVRTSSKGDKPSHIAWPRVVTPAASPSSKKVTS